MTKKKETKETSTLGKKVVLKKDQNLVDNIKQSANKLNKAVESKNTKQPEKFCFRKDDDSHLYLLPVSLADDFSKDEEKANKTDDYNDFNDKYEQYRCSHHMNCYVFENPVIKE